MLSLPRITSRSLGQLVSNRLNPLVDKTLNWHGTKLHHSLQTHVREHAPARACVSRQGRLGDRVAMTTPKRAYATTLSFG
jgi:hypothetical protein